MRRRDGRIGCGARGRGMNAPPKLPGGAGVPPGGTTTPREERADGGPHDLPEALRAQLPKRGRRFPSRRQGETERQKARPGAVCTLRWRAERRHVLATARDLHCMMRRLARHPLDLFEGRKACPREGGEDYGVPGAAKNTGDGACADNDWQGSIARHDDRFRPRPARRHACSHR
jgi:hypothetical protein